jgi:hypothetical protein
MHRITKLIAIAAAVAACGQPAGGNGDAAAQASGGGGQAAYVDACVARYVAQNAQAQAWAPDQCVQDWGRIAASSALAEAILAAASGALPSGNRLGADLEVRVDRSARTATWVWAQTGALIPYDAVGALEQRGATVAMIGCSQLGAGEFNKAYSVTPSAGAPFQLSVYERTAPTGDASSFYSATAHPAGRVPTRAQLASDGMEWTERCAY